VLTSSREPRDINRAYDLGANSYLVKPVSFDALLEMVQVLDRYWLGLAERPEAPRAHPAR
jgi:DNA-binding response OmpR family regulator